MVYRDQKKPIDFRVEGKGREREASDGIRSKCYFLF